MKTIRLLLLPAFFLTVWATTLSAQTTREQADAIVLNHLRSEITQPYLVKVSGKTYKMIKN